MAHPATPTQPARPELHDVLPQGCVELHAMALHVASDGELPTWIHCVPGGDEIGGVRHVIGRDGRHFVVDDPQRVIAGTELPMQLDWEHASMFPTYYGGTTRAAAWADAFEWVPEAETTPERPLAGFWARVSRWTPDGERDVRDGYFRGLSPVVRYELGEDDDAPPQLRGVVNVALTNRPNLKMTLLHSEQPHHAPPAPGGSMDENEKALRTRLGLAETATHAEVARAVLEQLLAHQAKAESSHARAAAAEAELERVMREQHNRAAEAALDGAVRDGKIPPASRALFSDLVGTAEGLARFTEHVATLPVLVPHQERQEGTPPSTHATGLTAAQRAIASRLGLTEDEYRESMKGAAAPA